MASGPPGQGYTLIIDLKTTPPEMAAQLQAILAPHRELLSSMPKQGGTFREGKITVCLTGNGAGHRAYADAVPADGEYLAFSDDAGTPGSWQSDVAAYVPKQPPGFVRFLTYEKQNFMDAANWCATWNMCRSIGSRSLPNSPPRPAIAWRISD